MTTADILAAVPAHPPAWSVDVEEQPACVVLNLRCDNMGEHARWSRNALHRLTPDRVRDTAQGMIDRLLMAVNTTRARTTPPQWGNHR